MASGCRSHLRSRCFDRGQTRGRHRVEVADCDGNPQPERERGVGAAVCGHDLRSFRQALPDARVRLSGGDDDDGALLAVHTFLRWHYPDQVRGSAVRETALSARMPELPVSLSGSY